MSTSEKKRKVEPSFPPLDILPIECPHGHDVRCCAYLTCAASSQIAATDYEEGP